MRRGTIPWAILKQWVTSAALVGGGCRAPLAGAAHPSLAEDAVHASAIAAAVNRTMSPLPCLASTRPGSYPADTSIAGKTYAELNGAHGN
jgi:hypothetical protein